MNKSKIINQAKDLLAKEGFGQQDYVISLQGPTVILAITGQSKMTPEIQKDLEEIGMIVLG
jgi:ABC-type transport system substrate-binding protein